MSDNGILRSRSAERLALSLARAAVRGLLALPPSVQVRLSRRPAVRVEGDTLAPEVQMALALLERVGVPALETMDVEEGRRARRRMAALAGGPPEPVGEVRDFGVPGGEGTVAARHYAPAGGGTGLLVYYHGGGFVFGDLETHDALCRILCRHADVNVLAVDYRLAPEHRFPAALEDAAAAYSWAVANAAELGAEATRVGVAGDSAGGNLAAVVSQMAARGELPPPALQLLIYPVTDVDSRLPSRRAFGEGFFLTAEEMDWFRDVYLGPGRDQSLRRDPRVSPLRCGDLSGCAPAIVATASFDPLRDEGEAYARALAAAGTPVLLRRHAGMIHAFASAPALSRDARDGVVELAGAARAVLGGIPLGGAAVLSGPV